MHMQQDMVVIASAWIGRLLTVLVQFASIRILLEGLGSAEYAVFVVLNSLMAWYYIADFGIGSSLQNYISELRAKGQPFEPYIFASVLISTGLLVAFIGIQYLISPYVAEFILGKFDFLDTNKKVNLVFDSGVLFICAGIGGVAFKIWYAQHRGYLSNIIPALSMVLGLMAAWCVVSSAWDQKLLLSLTCFIFPSALLSLLSLSWHGIISARMHLQLQGKILRDILRRSLHFWIMYIVAIVALNADYIVMSQYLSPHEIVIYAISSRAFSFVAFFYTSVYAALWPRFSESIARNDWIFVLHKLKQSLSFSALLIGTFTIVSFFYMNEMATYLSPREEISIPRPFILMLGCYHVLLAWCYGFSIILQSMSNIKILLIWGSIQAVFSIMLQIIFTPLLGIYGTVLGFVLPFLLIAWVLPRKVFSYSKILMSANAV
jgi:O-antigen/teichoic acid export membrane protein